MNTYVLTGLVCGVLALGTAPVYSAEKRVGESHMKQTEESLDKNPPIFSSDGQQMMYELTDEELDQVTGSGFGMLPEIPMIQLPMLPEIPAFPELPQLPELPGLPNLPNIPELPQNPNTPINPSPPS